MFIAVVMAAVTAVGGSTIPDGFLLWEERAKGPADSWNYWKIDDRVSTPLTVDPCHTAVRTSKNRYAARTVVHTAELQVESEQLVLYKDEESAHAAMEGLRADLRRCAKQGQGWTSYSYYSKPLNVGDEGIRVGARYFEGGLRQIAVRKGAALVIYTQSFWPDPKLPMADFRALVTSARELTAKACWLPEARC